MRRIRTSLSWKLGASFAAVVALLAVMIGTALWAMSSLSAEQHTVYAKITPRMIAADDARSAVADQHFSQTQYVLVGTPASHANYLIDHRVYGSALATLQEVSTSPADLRSFDAVKAATARFNTLDTQLWNLVKAGNRTAAVAIVNGPENTAADTLSKALTAYQNRVRGEQRQQAANFASTESTVTWILIALGIGAVTVAIVLAYFLARQVSGGAREMLAAADGIAAGDLDQTITVTTADEVGQTAEAFKRMVAYLQTMAAAATRIADGDLTAEVEPMSERDTLGTAFATMIASLRSIVGDVREAATTMSASSQQMASSSQETGRAVEEIARAIVTVAEGAEQQVQMVTTTRDEAERSAESAAQMQTASSDGVQAAEQATVAMADVRDSSTSVTAAMQELATKSGEIGGIVETITGIAEQTNLLALNAAIEAARAGEQGRGFAVVAEEVRKLAEESQEAATRISELIERIQAETRSTVDAVEAGNARIERGAAVVEQTREAFDRIGQAMTELTGRIDRIGTATAQVAAVAEQSSATAEQVSASTEQTSASTQEIAATAQELASTAARLESVVGRFSV